MAPTTILLILFLAGGGVLIGISIPLVRRRIGPNPWYGFRVRPTLEDPEVWYPANAYSGRWLLSAGVAEIVVATALYFVPDLEIAVYAAIVGGVTVAGIVIGFVQSLRFVRRLTKERETAI